MAYTLDPENDEGKLRILVFDTDSTDYLFEDDELTAILDLNSGDVFDAAASLCRSIAANLAKKAIKLGLGKGDILLDKTKPPAFFIKMAQDYETRSGSNVAEYMDSANIYVSGTGIDESEYVGDL